MGSGAHSNTLYLGGVIGRPSACSKDARHLLRPGCDAPVDLAERYERRVVLRAGQAVDDVVLTVPGGIGKADQDPLPAQRFDQFPRPGGVVHQKQDAGGMRVCRQDGQDLQRVVLAHDDQHQVVGVLGRERLDDVYAGDRLLLRSHVVQHDAALMQVDQALPARQD